MHSAICWKTRVSVRYSPYSVSVGSDNPDGAENQQERLIQQGWVVGFVDGEGCFSVSFVRGVDVDGVAVDGHVHVHADRAAALLGDLPEQPGRPGQQGEAAE